MAQRESRVTGGVRTAIGGYGSSLKAFRRRNSSDRDQEAVARAKIDPRRRHVVLGSVITATARHVYLARRSARRRAPGRHALPDGQSPVRQRAAGDSSRRLSTSCSADTGRRYRRRRESMSRAAYFMPAARWGQRMGDSSLIDAMSAALNDPFGHGHMGVTAEKHSGEIRITRGEQDAFALESHRRAAKAIDAGTSEARSSRSK